MMVRPHSGSPRSRQRSFSDGGHGEHHGGRPGPPPRGFRGPPGKAPPSWREGNGGGHSPYPRNKRPPMGDPRERVHGHWTPQNQHNFRPYPVSQDSQHGRRRSPPSRLNRPPPVQNRHSPHGPSGHHRPFHGNHSGHVSPSSRYFHSPSSERRGPSPHNAFRVPQRFQNSPHEQERSWGPGRPPNPRDRPFGRPANRGHRWNGRGGYPHPNGEPRPSGPPLRKPREFDERNSYPERWSTERDPRKQHGDAGKGRGRGRPGHHAPEWARGEAGEPYPRPSYRSPSWKSGPSTSSNSFSRFAPSPRPPMRPMKRRFQEMGPPPPLPHDLEHGPPKRFRREMPVRPMPLKGFGGRGLSLKDKSRLMKGRKFREESVARFKMPPPKPRPSDKIQRNKMREAEHMGESSRLPPHKILLKKNVKRRPSRESPVDADSKSSELELDSETQVEPRRSVRARSSSPLDRQLTRDLVVVSHWEAGTRSSSPKSSTSWKSRISHNDNKTGQNPNHRFGSSAHDQKQHRLMDGPGKPLRRPGPFQKPNFRAAPVLQKGSDGVFRRPLMATVFPRPSLHQKPVFRKSQSIMTKYKNMQTLRHKAPPHPRQGTSYRRW